MKTYKQAVDKLAEQSFHKYMGGEFQWVSADCDLISWVYDVPADKVESDVRGLVNILHDRQGGSRKVIPITALHTCPYLEEIAGDYETLCDCDPDQEHNCIMNI